MCRWIPLVVALALALTGCAHGSVMSEAADRQAEFDKACQYASGVVSAVRPVIPVIQQLILVKFGQDTSTAFLGLLAVIETTCSEPLNISDSRAVIQRVYDAGGQLVALIARSQAGT